MPDQKFLRAFIAAVESGKHDEAIERFHYDKAARRFQTKSGLRASARQTFVCRAPGKTTQQCDT
ncbi:MAG: hypothetical protein KGJ49_08150 [Alphaproteobacteria bacterium]|nr:hypothetical protein [Alphaproteobacteria bacterium]